MSFFGGRKVWKGFSLDTEEVKIGLKGVFETNQKPEGESLDSGPFRVTFMGEGFEFSGSPKNKIHFSKKTQWQRNPLTHLQKLSPPRRPFPKQKSNKY